MTRLFPFLAAVAILFLAGCAGVPGRLPVSRCWVQIFERPGFDPAGAHDIFFGPGRWGTLEGLPGGSRDWSGTLGSLIAGPEARVLLWEEKGFGGQRICLEPGALVAAPEDLPLRRPGSLAIECRDSPGR